MTEENPAAPAATTTPTLASKDLAVTLHAPEIVSPVITTASIKATVDDILGALPADATGCLLAVGAIENGLAGAHLVIAQRLNDHWQVGGKVGWVNGEGYAAQVVSRFTW